MYKATYKPYKSKFNGHLEKYKNIHVGESAILFMNGPTRFSYTPIKGSENFIKVGANRIWDFNTDEDIKNLNYWFFGSEYFKDSGVIHRGGKEERTKVDKICYDPQFNKLIKFTSSWEDGRSHGEIGRGNITPERSRELGAIPYENNLGYFSHDIAKYATLGHDVVYPALQFLLYMGVSRIFLVGCDCGYTPLDSVDTGDPEMLYWWNEFKKWQLQYYPSIQIITVNPVPKGLKGMFDDLYQNGFENFNVDNLKS